MRRLILCGVSAPLGFCVVMLIAGVLTPGYSQRDNTLSELGMPGSPWAPGWNWLGFVPLGAQMLVFAAAFFAISRARATSALLALCGLGYIGVGVVPARDGFAPSAQTSIHFALAGLSFFPFVAAAVVFGIAHARRRVWRAWAMASLALGALALATFGLPRTLPGGLVQRLGIALCFVWMTGAAFVARRVAVQEAMRASSASASSA